MIAHKLDPDFWPVDVAHATDDAVAVWHCSRGRGSNRRNFYIFKQPKGRYLVRERGTWGWTSVGDDIQTLSAAKAAAEQEE